MGRHLFSQTKFHTRPKDLEGVTMTAQQALRRKRRRQRDLQRKQQVRETILAVLTLLFILIAYVFAGTQDYIDEQRQIALWEERGVTIQRW